MKSSSFILRKPLTLVALAALLFLVVLVVNHGVAQAQQAQDAIPTARIQVDQCDPPQSKICASWSKVQHSEHAGYMLQIEEISDSAIPEHVKTVYTGLLKADFSNLKPSTKYRLRLFTIYCKTGRNSLGDCRTGQPSVIVHTTKDVGEPPPKSIRIHNCYPPRNHICIYQESEKNSQWNSFYLYIKEATADQEGVPSNGRITGSTYYEFKDLKPSTQYIVYAHSRYCIPSVIPGEEKCRLSARISVTTTTGPQRDVTNLRKADTCADRAANVCVTWDPVSPHPNFSHYEVRIWPSADEGWKRSQTNNTHQFSGLAPHSGLAPYGEYEVEIRPTYLSSSKGFPLHGKTISKRFRAEYRTQPTAVPASAHANCAANPHSSICIRFNLGAPAAHFRYYYIAAHRVDENGQQTRPSLHLHQLVNQRGRHGQHGYVQFKDLPEHSRFQVIAAAFYTPDARVKQNQRGSQFIYAEASAPAPRSAASCQDNSYKIGGLKLNDRPGNGTPATQVNISWNKLPCVGGHYVIRYWESSNQTGTIQELRTSWTNDSLRVANLKRNTEYTFRVLYQESPGKRPWKATAPIKVTTPAGNSW